MLAEKKMATGTAKVGTRAPAFSLPCTEVAGSGARQVSLDDFTDRWLILVFYSRDFSLV
jgi:peroxiredoxin